MKKKNNLRLQDPFLEREREQYEHPLPSREFVLQILTEQSAPMADEELLNLLFIEKEEEELFSRRLRAMERDGQIMRNRKRAICVVDKLDLIKGKVQGHADGFGFLIPEDGSADMFLSEKEMHKVFHGDVVMARQSGVDRRGRPEAKIVEVLERATNRLVGRLYEEHGIYFVVAENRKVSQDILVAPGASGGAKVGQVVMLEIMQQPSRHAQPIGRVVGVLGNYGDPGMEIEIALRKHDLPYEFPKDAEHQAQKIAPTVSAADWAGREDIRNLPLVTIDGETARDFDDAVYCQPEKGGYRLVVAIADVSYYVQPNDALDREAILRGNSVYFPRRVIPMLPEELSNGLCSLNPQVDRLCMVCDMHVSSKGEIGKYRFYPSVMYSNARLTYTQVAEMLEQPDGELAKSNAVIVPHLQHLHALFQKLLQARAKRGAIDFETVETQMIFTDQGKIERIVPVVRNDAHKLIEECMLAANVCAAEFLSEHQHPVLYRIHQGPTPEKLEALREFMKEFGLGLTGEDEPQAADYSKLLNSIKGRPDAGLLQTVMLRSLRQAKYEPENIGHFGLGYDAYTHFTSPIRRYPDLLVHRAIKAVLQNKQYKPEQKWSELGAHCSMTERRADDATRDVEAWLKCFYMRDHLGSVYMGSVSSVTSFGMFVSLDDLYVEGLVHISELGKDYYHFDATKHQLSGERTGKNYRLGDRVEVRVVKVDMESTKIDFVLHVDEDEGDEAAATAKSKKKAVKRKNKNG
ncbi:MAG: ribonuclease R [Gallionellales bacterium CG_4_10_14_3_um_filter_54_96]|nr:MAG: ribonuclease R [Gallionellales bacterium CG17_big_fil_post_rev_8_21_14_2_50_54_146]PIX04843.1 MAG: ribonuclease R [Gallionellales bacterium CG_4_8_14_3_um_filter_54_18]PIY06196.1 MAG: ribonuclease R [Gallionellales bacterium CG_4_10_14_3_um_filter_54_96]PJC03375.1 MAG: ribonuclease R [Gallionellales bacterium CG_4_9_14_0_8_um_filter_55_61]